MPSSEDILSFPEAPSLGAYLPWLPEARAHRCLSSESVARALGAQHETAKRKV